MSNIQEETKQKQIERDSLTIEEPTHIPESLDPVSESEVKPEEAQSVTTSLAQNLDIEDKNPLSTEPSQKVEQSQESNQEDLSQSNHQDQGEQHQGSGQQLYTSEGVLIDL